MVNLRCPPVSDALKEKATLWIEKMKKKSLKQKKPRPNRCLTGYCKKVAIDSLKVGDRIYYSQKVYSVNAVENSWDKTTLSLKHGETEKIVSHEKEKIVELIAAIPSSGTYSQNYRFMYESGWSIAAIASHFGETTDVIKNKLIKDGVTIKNKLPNKLRSMAVCRTDTKECYPSLTQASLATGMALASISKSVHTFRPINGIQWEKAKP
jgi:hypothetical protein